MTRQKTNMLEEILVFNENFVKNKAYEAYTATKQPSKKVVILSCMDTRLTELLPQAMNIKNGDAKIIKNAGATIMHPFGSITRSIIVAIYEFNVKDIMVVGHYGCGMAKLDSGALIEKMQERGITQETIKTLEYAGRHTKQWLHGFESEQEAVEESVEAIRNHPLVPEDVHIHGLIMDPYTGKLEVLINGYEY